ncbi:hypothetical protein BLNAU_5753 [Blattamonas nauphoetae]|uniref:Uncharacterized protein n=1 Tax=Blattamonas nauphoetae TaxID=2049346 RepID=A0ABQ9Y671_9EUKA|nr:hypothetical protein BLNAU_5753 [Blattamonas nauphoetae]
MAKLNQSEVAETHHAVHHNRVEWVVLVGHCSAFCQPPFGVELLLHRLQLLCSLGSLGEGRDSLLAFRQRGSEGGCGLDGKSELQTLVERVWRRLLLRRIGDDWSGSEDVLRDSARCGLFLSELLGSDKVADLDGDEHVVAEAEDVAKRDDFDRVLADEPPLLLPHHRVPFASLRVPCLPLVVQLHSFASFDHSLSNSPHSFAVAWIRKDVFSHLVLLSTQALLLVSFPLLRQSHIPSDSPAHAVEDRFVESSAHDPASVQPLCHLHLCFQCWGLLLGQVGCAAWRADLTSRRFRGFDWFVPHQHPTPHVLRPSIHNVPPHLKCFLLCPRHQHHIALRVEPCSPSTSRHLFVERPRDLVLSGIDGADHNAAGRQVDTSGEGCGAARDGHDAQAVGLLD